MTQSLGARLSNGRRFLPLAATIVMFGLVYAFGVLSFPAMRDSQPMFNLVNTAPFLLIAVVGQALVIISGGIDLSVGGVIALTTVATAALLETGWDPPVVIMLMLLMGITIGAVMGFFITYLKVQPFIATLAGMWFARGMCYLISDAEIRIYDPAWKTLAGIRVLIPGLADPVAKTGSYLTILGVVALVVLAAGIFVAHLTRFGRTLYAMGGNSGRNEVSARLMGLPINRTKMQVYMVSGFCSALAGLAYSVYVGSGHGSHAMTMELTVIAAVVIGGVALTGGQGYVLGAFFGVLILALIQSLILYQGQLSSWWTSIFIGLLMLLFIGVQSVLATLNSRSLARASTSGGAVGWRRAPWRDRRLLGGAAVVLAAVIGIYVVAPLTTAPQTSGDGNGAVASDACQPGESREQEAADLQAGGAVIVFQRVRRLRLRGPALRHPSGRAGRRLRRNATARGPSRAGGRDRARGQPRGAGVVHRRHVHDLAPPLRRVLHLLRSPSPPVTRPRPSVRSTAGRTRPSKYWLATSRISAILPRSDAP